MLRFVCIYYLIFALSFYGALCVSEHSLTYTCTDDISTTNGTIDAVEGQITEFNFTNSSVCEITCFAGGEGETVDWRDLFGNSASRACIEGSVCQRTISSNEKVLRLDKVKEPTEYKCDIQHGAMTIFFHIRFLLPDTVIPDIIISTQPYFPVNNNTVTVTNPNINILCSSNGYPTPKYGIQYDPLYTEDTELGIGLEFTDTPKYIMCTADNGVRVSRIVELVPDFSISQKPANVSISADGSNIVIRWQPVSNHFEEYTNYSISYSSLQDSDTILHKPELLNGWYNYTLNLEHCTQYNISMYGYNRNGDGPMHSTLNFTKPTKITDAPSDLKVLTNGTTFLFLIWNKVITKSCDISPISYHLSYASVEPPDMSKGEYSITGDMLARNKLSTGHFYFILKGLEEFYTYNVTLLARNTEGDGPVVMGKFQTLPAVPSSPPQDLRLDSVTKLVWKPPAIQYQNGIISSYTVQLRYEFTNVIDTKYNKEYVTDKEEFEIERYPDAVMIQVMVRARNQVGEGPAATLVINAPSSPPQDLKLVDGLLQWKPPAIQYQNGIIINYTVQLRYEFINGTKESREYVTDKEEIEIEQYPCAVMIQVMVRARNQVGEGPPATLIINYPLSGLPEVLCKIGEQTPTVSQSMELVNTSLQELATNESDVITPRQTSVVVESLTKSLEGLNDTNIAEFDRTFFMKFIRASSLVWENGIQKNEGGSANLSTNYGNFLNLVDSFSIHFARAEGSRMQMKGKSCDNIEYSSIHTIVCKLANVQIQEFSIDLTPGFPILNNSMISISTIRMNINGSIVSSAIISYIKSVNIVTRNSSDSIPTELSAIILFQTKNIEGNFAPSCVFFNTTTSQWSLEGVQTQQREGVTECTTSHLTSFAVLVRPFEPGLTPEQYLALSIVTYILLSISAVLLAVSIVLYLVSCKQTLVVEANIVYFNFAIALFLATCTFLFGIQTATNDYIGCFIVTILIHYTWLAVFSWSFCIAVLLLHKIWFVFSERKIWPYLLAVGWVTPAVIVAISAGTANARYIRTGADHCWLSREQGLSWSFLGPIIAILLVNVVLLAVCVCRIYFSLKRFDKDKGKLHALKVALSSAVVMVPVLNTPWLLLLFTLDKSTYSIIVEWIFVFINGSNGIIFFFLFVLRNREIQKFFRTYCFRCLPDRELGSSGITRASKYSLKKQRTSESYADSKFRGDSIDYKTTTSPRHSFGVDFPAPIPKLAKKKGGFEALSTQIDDEPEIDPPKSEIDETKPELAADKPEPEYEPVVQVAEPEPVIPVAEPEPVIPVADPEPVIPAPYTKTGAEAPAQPASEPIYSTVVKKSKLPKESAPPTYETIPSDDDYSADSC